MFLQKVESFKDLYIGEAHTELDKFRFAVFFYGQKSNSSVALPVQLVTNYCLDINEQGMAVRCMTGACSKVTIQDLDRKIYITRTCANKGRNPESGLKEMIIIEGRFFSIPA